MMAEEFSRMIRPFYGRDYNEGRPPEWFGGYTAPGHWENAERWRASASGVFSALLTFAPEADTVLDLGCGRGSLVTAMRALGLTAFGLDITDDVMPAFCTQGSTLAIPLKGPFDVVLALDIIEHVPSNLQGVLFSELRRVLGTGLMLATVPTRPPHYRLSDDVSPRNHYLSGSPLDWGEHFAAHGLSVVAQGVLARYGPPFSHGEDNYPFALRAVGEAHA